jgi:F0F1-type ATP synthase assembly protein I
MATSPPDKNGRSANDKGTVSGDDRFSGEVWKMASTGFELAGSIVLFCLIGYFVDYRWGTSPKGILIGSITGIIVGLYLLIKEALMSEYSSRKDQSGGPEDKKHDSDEHP